MSVMDEDKIFDEVEIRNTSVYNSLESVSGEFHAKTIIVQNGLNEDVTLQLQGARNSVWFDIGSAFVQGAQSNGYKTVSDYFPKYRLQAQCGQDPSSGSLTSYIIKANPAG